MCKGYTNSTHPITSDRKHTKTEMNDGTKGGKYTKYTVGNKPQIHTQEITNLNLIHIYFKLHSPVYSVLRPPASWWRMAGLCCISKNTLNKGNIWLRRSSRVYSIQCAYI